MFARPLLATAALLLALQSEVHAELTGQGGGSGRQYADGLSGQGGGSGKYADIYGGGGGSGRFADIYPGGGGGSGRPVIMDGSVKVLERVQVPFKMCHLVSNIQKLDGWITTDGLESVDVGSCSEGCMASPLTGKKECAPTKTTTVTLINQRQPTVHKQLEVILACGCVCCEHHICRDGEYWNAANCRCSPKLDALPCQRFPQHTQAFGMTHDLGMCFGHCDDVTASCRPLEYRTNHLAVDGATAQVSSAASCGCSSCAVKSQWVALQIEDGSVVWLDIGQCDGKCGPETWPDDATAGAPYWTTTCARVATAPLYVPNSNIVLERVTRCDCQRVKPPCQRLPKYVTFYGAAGEQQLDVGACEGRCEKTGAECVATASEPVDCGTNSPEACSKYSVITECGCQAPPTTAPAPTVAPVDRTP